MTGCFAPETRLMTLRGDVAAGALRAGEMLLTLSGGGAALKPLRHVGRCRLSEAPIRVHAGAIADGCPRRDLLLTPGHAVRPGIAGLAPVATLTNGATVARDGAVAEWVELTLAAPDIVLAEGLAVGLGWDGLADPVARTALRERACALGWSMTADPCLCVCVAGEALVPLRRTAEVCDVMLPPGRGPVVLRSRAAVPEEIDPAMTDARRLGVAVVGLSADGVAIALDDPRLGDGFLPPEPGLRWTDGNAMLNLSRAGQTRLELRLSPIWTRYWRFG